MTALLHSIRICIVSANNLKFVIFTDHSSDGFIEKFEIDSLNMLLKNFIALFIYFILILYCKFDGFFMFNESHGEEIEAFEFLSRLLGYQILFFLMSYWVFIAIYMFFPITHAKPTELICTSFTSHMHAPLIFFNINFTLWTLFRIQLNPNLIYFFRRLSSY